MPRKRTNNSEEVDSGDLESSWPPDWMTSYADCATLLMTFFIILSTLLVLRIDPRWLGTELFSTQEAPTTKDRVLVTFTVRQKRMIESFKKLDQQQTREEAAIQQLQQMRTEIQQYILPSELEEFAEIDTSKWKIKIIPLVPLFFSPARATLRPDGKDFLDRLAKFLQMNPGQISISGHTDNLPIYNPVYRSNWELSCARSSNIMRYLIKNHEIKPERFIAVGYGPYHPVAPNDTPEGRMKNRRVEIEIIQDPRAGGVGEATGELAI